MRFVELEAKGVEGTLAELIAATVGANRRVVFTLAEACPDLDDQAALWSLLDPDEIGITLTDGMMMEPEASVSALLFHHPDARYFSVSGTR